MEKTGRKTYSGPKKDKERTKQKLLKAVAEVISKKGHNGLTARNVVARAGVDRRLIYDYFGGFNDLVETYLRNKDYWNSLSSQFQEIAQKNSAETPDEFAKSVLLNQLEFFYNNQELQQIIRWQFSENSAVMHDLCVEREKIGSELFKATDFYFAGSDVDLRAVVALLIGGIYSLVLHSKTSDTTFCEIDINTSEGMERIRKALIKIIEGTYAAARAEK